MPVFKWPTEPIVQAEMSKGSLSFDATWPSNVRKAKFTITNPSEPTLLQLKFNFRYIRPYGGWTNFVVVVDVFKVARFVRKHRQEIHVSATDNAWHTESQYYLLLVNPVPPVLIFQVGVTGLMKGALPTGFGDVKRRYSKAESQRFSANFQRQ